jgi:hypothetical protein
MTADLDLTRSHFTRDYGSITLYGTWFRRDDTFSPCLTLVPSGAETRNGLIPCVVTLSRAYIWSDRPGIGEPEEAARIAIQFAEYLGFNSSNMSTVFKIVGIIQDNIGELFKIPPYTPPDSESVGIAVVRNLETGSATETEIFDDV